MPRLLIFGGTTEAREILERGIPALCCVATDYGAETVKHLPDAVVRVGRLDAAGMEALIKSEDVTCVIDATHPYAAEVTKNIRAACERTNTPLLRVCRAPAANMDGNVTVVSSCREAAETLNRRGGNVLLTVGSKELSEFTVVRDYQKRLFARVLPTSNVLKSCEELGFDGAHIIAMQGPFSKAMNRALIESTAASVLVTKDGGAPGGTGAKLAAAREAGIEVIMIARPEDGGHTIEEGVLWARRMLALSRPPLFPLMTDVEGRDVLVVGGGDVALRRTITLLKCGARVRAVSPVFRDDFPREAERIERPFAPSDLDGMTLAVAASGDREVNKLVGHEARTRNIPVSVADAAAEGSFFFPSLIASGEAAASVSTGGLSCSMTRRLSDRLRAVWDTWVAEERAALNERGCSGHGER
jgi:precorrin-2 dehydrogenase/sirohydrochlorin ferrochelatase/precorrin-6A/cobalt-precorrin-6A reductase